LAFREKELADREKELADKGKRLAKKQLQELAVAHKRLEELQATEVVEAKRSRTFWAKMRLCWCPSASVHFTPRNRYRRCSRCLTPQGPIC
jgi:hypothetical protein